MKTLVTGATGFVGRHLVKRLVEEGISVTCLVRETSDIKFLKELGVELVYGNIMNKESLEKAVEDIDLIFHLAGEVYPKRSKRYFHANVIGTRNLMQACVGKNIRKVVYFSSTAVYGPTKERQLFVDETYPCNPISDYGKSKLEAEGIVLHYYREFGVPVTVLRPPVVYGPGLNRFSIAFIILNLILKEKFIMIGDGDNYMSLSYISNLIQGTLLAAYKEESIGEIFIIADEENNTFKEMVHSIYKAAGITDNYSSMPVWLSKIAASFLFLLTTISNYPVHISPNTINELIGGWGTDISKAKKILGYMPTFNFNESIRETVSSLKNK